MKCETCGAPHSILSRGGGRGGIWGWGDFEGGKFVAPPNSGRGKIVGAGMIFFYRFFKRRLDKKGSFCEGVDEFSI